MRKCFITLILCRLCPFLADAQFSITGKVISADDHLPLPNASVFINNTTIGCTADAGGKFNLLHIKPGDYELVVTMVGFNTVRLVLKVAGNSVSVPDIMLAPSVNNLREVSVSARQDARRDGYMDLFQRTFLGTSARAGQCKILNPELIDFHYDAQTKTLSSQSVDYLLIENKALGYKIRYLLTYFRLDQSTNQFAYEGPVYFEPMLGPDEQQLSWKKGRDDLYNNTITSFLRAALQDRLAENGFSVFRCGTNPARMPDSIISSKIMQLAAMPRNKRNPDTVAYWQKQQKMPRLLPKKSLLAVTAPELVTKANGKGTYILSCDGGALLIVYGEGHVKAAHPDMVFNDGPVNSLIFFNQPSVYFDSEGRVLNPHALSYTGAWGDQRVADLLPADFQPGDKPADDLKLYARLDTLIHHQILQKAYLHLDKPYYMGGDTIYLKAYLQQSNLNPADIETQINVDLLRPDRTLADRLRLKVKDAVAAGDIALPDSLSAGTYALVAYTRASPGCPPAVLFEQQLVVATMPGQSVVAQQTSPGKTGNNAKSSKTKPAKAGIDVQFFAEGGNFVGGVLNKVAFKAIGPEGLGADVEGDIFDDLGKLICKFKSQHLGMGGLTIKPEAGRAYKAIVLLGDGHKASFSLPVVATSGYQLGIDNSAPHKINICIKAATKSEETRVSILGEASGRICYFSSPVLKDGAYSADILTDNLPKGIIRFTLFSAAGVPMNERLVFIRKADGNKLMLSGLQPDYKPRNKTVFQLKCTDASGKPVNGNFSVSVTGDAANAVSNTGGSSILTNWLLTSELSGDVEQPGYYFSNTDDVNSNLDVLMLTQGYREFHWKSVMRDAPAPMCKPEAGTFISGIIRDMHGKPVPHVRVMMLSVSKVFFTTDTVADSSGRFVFTQYPIGDMRYIIQAADKTLRKKSTIELDDHIPADMLRKAAAVNTDTALASKAAAYAKLENRFLDLQSGKGFGKHGILLKEVTVKNTKQKKLHSDNLNGAGVANDVIMADQLPPGCPVLKDCIAGRLHGIQYFGGNFYYLFWRTLVVVDGVEVPGNLGFVNGTPKLGPGPSQNDILSAIGTQNIASIEIIRDASLAAVYGVRGAGGVIVITTKTASDIFVDPKNVHIAYQYYTPAAYYKARVFYAPKYTVPQPPAQQTDLRTTVFWAPFLKTKSAEGAQVEFYNSDLKGTYWIVIEGIDENGSPVRAVSNYAVN